MASRHSVSTGTNARRADVRHDAGNPRRGHGSCGCRPSQRSPKDVGSDRGRTAPDESSPRRPGGELLPGSPDVAVRSSTEMHELRSASGGEVMERPRCTQKVVRGLTVAFALVNPAAVTASNDLGSAQAWLQQMREWQMSPPERRGRPRARRTVARSR